MLKPDLDHCASLEELYTEAHRIYKDEGHDNYAAHHNALIKYAKKCDTIRELGVMQGISLAGMMMTNPRDIVGVDTNDSKYKKFHSLFTKYARENEINYQFILGSSLDPSHVKQVEMLHIDTLHIPSHLRQELHLHMPSVTRYAAFHDTANHRNTKGLLMEIVRYITEVDQNWRIVEHNTDVVGYTVLERHYRRK